MINWDKIQKKCPKANEKFEHYEYWFDDLSNGDIFYFFDEQGIFIQIGPPIGDTPHCFQWDYAIILPKACDKEYFREDGDLFDTRILAEEAAIERAFEILEKMI